MTAPAPNAYGRPAQLVREVLALENDPAARAAFFAQPVLAPGAQAWVERACAVAGDRLALSVAHRDICYQRTRPL